MYVKPNNLDDALTLLAQAKWSILAGGTDVYPNLQEGYIESDTLDISGIRELHGIRETKMEWTIGALTTWTDLIKNDLPIAFNALKQAAKEVGSIQIQNRGTIVGNLCNASPAADGIPPLMILGATINLTSVRGTRSITLQNFIEGNRKTTRQVDELVTSVTIPKSSCGGKSAFSKLGSRKYMVISIVMVAVKLELGDDGLIRDTAISVGACSEIAKRLETLEETILGKTLEQAIRSVDKFHLITLSPITDIRAPKTYRIIAAQEIIKRTILACGCAEDKNEYEI
ncbi:MAG: xanthine dehydrogenase [Rhodospirillaceae bacterium]|nr:xanthine dehydrogenase [Rhodospirillaceae bacterium]